MIHVFFFALPLCFLEFFAVAFYLSGFACLRCWVCLMCPFHIPVVWCIELEDVSLSVFSCVSVRDCSESHCSLSLSIIIPNQRG